MEQDKTPDPIDVALLGTNAVVLAAQHAAHLIQEPRLDRGLERQVRLFCVTHANRGFVGAFSVPSLHNGLIPLKDDKCRRRMGYPDTAFRRSTLSWASRDGEKVHDAS